MFQHHREQVFTRKTFHHFHRLGCHRHRVAVVHNHGVDQARRVQRVADGAHVDQRRFGIAVQVGPLQTHVVGARVVRGAHQHTTGAVTPGAGERGQAGDGTYCIAAAATALHTVVQAYARRCGVRVVVRELANVFCVQSADRCRAFGRPLQCAFAQSFKTQGVLRDVVVVQPVVRDEFVHQRQGQRRIRAGLDGQVQIAFVGGLAAARVNAHQARAMAFGFLRDTPEMDVAGDGVAAPDDDQFGFGKETHLHAELAAQRVGKRVATGIRANGAVEFGRAQQIEKTHGDGLALHQTHGARVAVRQQFFWVGGDDGL